MITKILTFVFTVASLILAYSLYSSIKTSIDETNKVERMEQDIIERLKLIRDTQLAYKAVNGQYTGGWDSLTMFVDTGRFYILQRTEKIITLAYGADSTSVTIDTLGTRMVRDSLFSVNSGYAGFDVSQLPYVPGIEPPVKFNLWASKIQKAGLMLDVIEVYNPKPVNPRRNEDSDYNIRKPLRFGSRSSVTVAGNWE